MTTKRFSGIALSLLLTALPAHAALRVLACEPEWGALAQELGGPLVEVSVATTAQPGSSAATARTAASRMCVVAKDLRGRFIVSLLGWHSSRCSIAASAYHRQRV